MPRSRWRSPSAQMYVQVCCRTARRPDVCSAEGPSSPWTIEGPSVPATTRKLSPSLRVLAGALVLFIATHTVAAVSPGDVRQYRVAHESAILDEFIDLLKIPNLA